MAITSSLYAGAALHLASARVHWVDSTVKAMLTTSAYAPAGDHLWRNSVTGEASGDGYTAGGIAVPGRTLTTTATGADLDCDDLVFPTMTVSDVRRVVIYVDAGDATTSALVGWIDLGGAVSTSAQTLTVGVGARLFSLAAA